MTLRERLVASVTDIRDRGRRLVELNLELLVAELKEKGRKFGAAIGLFVGAGLLALYAIGFALATIVVLLALVLPLWASMLIVTVVLFVVVAVLVLVGRDQLRRIGKPEPEAAIAEAKATADLVRTSTRVTAAGVRDRARPSRRRPEPEVLPPRLEERRPPAAATSSPGTPGTTGTPPASGPAADPGREEP
jgi:membrane protein implicated in regulation of membrane protease activity